MAQYKVDKWGYINFRSDDIPGSVAAYKALGARWASINDAQGFSLTTPLDFLLDCPEVTGIHVVNCHLRDINVVPRLSWLQRLSLDAEPEPIDLSGLRRLTVLKAVWHPKTELPGAGTPITELLLRRYSPKSQDLSTLPVYPLTALELVRGNLVSLHGLERFTTLVSLDLSYMSKLSDICAIGNSPISRLHLESIRSISDWNCLSHSRHLQSIRMSNMGVVPSLAFVTRLSTLRELRFPSVTVGDGDLSPLLTLESVAFDDRKGYSHTEADVVRLIAKRHHAR